MFYFFKKGNDTITCEVRTSSAGPGYDIIVIEPAASSARKPFRRRKRFTNAGSSCWNASSGTAGGARTFRMDARRILSAARRSPSSYLQPDRARRDCHP